MVRIRLPVYYALQKVIYPVARNRSGIYDIIEREQGAASKWEVLKIPRVCVKTVSGGEHKSRAARIRSLVAKAVTFTRLREWKSRVKFRHHPTASDSVLRQNTMSL